MYVQIDLIIINMYFYLSKSAPIFGSPGKLSLTLQGYSQCFMFSYYIQLQRIRFSLS